MMQRCSNPKHPNYANYGGRGIAVCLAWREFFVFLAAMGKRPAHTTLDRIDNGGNYEPGNCRWATEAQQHRNRRDNVWITFAGETLTQMDWAERAGVANCTLAARIARGWPLELALTEPPKLGRRHLRESFIARRESALKGWRDRRAAHEPHHTPEMEVVHGKTAGLAK